MRCIFSLLLPILFLLTGAPVQAEPKEAKTAPHVRMSWQQRFVHANHTHDGRLTREQANAAFPSVARWFDAIDADEKGYVTVSDIAAWHKARREVRRATEARNKDQERRPAPPPPSMSMSGRGLAEAGDPPNIPR